MSRVSSNPIRVPSNVEVRIAEDNIHIKGPLGSLQFSITNELVLDMSDSMLRVKLKSESHQANAISGTTRAVLANMVYGVSIGFEKRLQLIGVGYRAQATVNKLNLTLGFSHPIDFEIPIGIKIETPTQTEIIIKGIDKQKVGQVAADIRAYRKPEPYKGKGIRYSDEVIVLKETKKK
ncbi:MAG: 50S ribosomal protein L6 [Proteobacteria bacterium]|nr:50S ribosomal protein L6 [Pseudomonadota bacterium]